MHLRPATPADEPFLREMLSLAVGWRDGAAALTPATEVYVRGFGRSGDAGLVAEEDGRPVGAAWYRRFADGEGSYGFVADDVPELALAVRGDRRGAGAGSSLLRGLIGLAAGARVPGLSLSVARDNPARRLYERAGFVTVAEADGACTMLMRLRFERPR